ncbi:hypothetical protein MJD09_18490, partial [bacterium]|nr:hypothetical protein [bacterium]
SGNNTIVSFHLQNRTTQSLRLTGAGRIESIVAIGGKLYITDWMANQIWVGNLAGVGPLADAKKAVLNGMIAPTHAKVIKDQYMVVSDLVGSKLFLFDATGTYLDVFEMSPNIGGIHEVAYTDAGGQPEFRIYGNGSGRQALTKKSSYVYDLRCGDNFTDLGGPSDEKSRFCVLPLD